MPKFVCADEILAHGSGDMFWIARVIEPAPGAGAALRTDIRGRGVGPDAQWTDVAQLPSRVTSLAHRGTQLAALLDSGAWVLLWPGGSTVGAQPLDGARLLMLASNDETIYAIGRGGKPAPATSTRASTAPARAPPPPPAHPEGIALYRLDRGRWLRVAPLPVEVTSSDLDRASFGVVGAAPMIAVLGAGGAVEPFAYHVNDVRWDRRAPLPASDATHLKLLAGDGDRPIVWLAPEAGAGRIHLAEQRGWGEPRELRTQEPVPSGAPRTVALAGGSVRLLFIRNGTTFEQAFDPGSGTPRTNAAQLRTSVSTVSDSLPGRVVTAAAAAMLLMVVMSSMRRAGAGAPDGAPASATGVVPAPLGRRFLAGAIDALPLLVALWFLFKDVDPDTQTVDDVRALVRLPFYLALGGYLVYTWLSETFFARTVGKALLGLRVASLDGSRPGALAVFARNALRLIDVTMLGLPLLLVLLSPLRQRVGDVAARTTVVSSTVPQQSGDATDNSASSEPPKT